MQATGVRYSEDVSARRSVARRDIERWAPLAGRIMLAAIFLISGFAKIADFGSTVGYMKAAGMPAVEVLAVAAIIVEIGCGLAMLLGAWTRASALMLLLYMIPVTLVFHAFWTYTGPEQRMQLINFLKNLAIMGGLTYVATYGAGLLGFDARRRREAQLQPPAPRPFARHPIGT